MINQNIMRLLTIIVLIISLAISQTSCTSTTGSQGDTNSNYRSGSQGLTMQIATGMPPAKIYDEEDLNVLVELYNKGASDLEGGNNKLYLSGFDGSIITGISPSGITIDNLDGKSIYDDEGGYTVASFDGFVRDLGSKYIDKYNVKL